MHPAEIKAEIRRRGWTLEGLSRSWGYSAKVVSVTLYRPWPAVEALIAEAIGREPRQIWPDRYHQNGVPRRKRAVKLTRRPRPHNV